MKYLVGLVALAAISLSHPNDLSAGFDEESPAAQPGYGCSLARDLKYLSFTATLEQFKAIRLDRNRSKCFNWCTDSCSVPKDTWKLLPKKLNETYFQFACARHDFGWRNFEKAGAFKANYKQIDSKLKDDMNTLCESVPGGCPKLAEAAKIAVDVGGLGQSGNYPANPSSTCIVNPGCTGYTCLPAPGTTITA